jgi:hypothetical protein
MFIPPKDPWLVKQESRLLAKQQLGSQAREGDLVYTSIYYAEWGRKIVYVPDIATAYDCMITKRIFAGLRSHIKSVTNSTSDGHGTHDCLINRRTGRIIGITYNNYPEKRAILEEILPIVLVDIIMSYAFPTHSSMSNPRLFQPSFHAQSD